MALNVWSRKWLVLAVNFLNMFLCAGFPFNMSVLNAEFLRVFEQSKAQTALVQSVTIGMIDVAGFLCGQYVHKYGCRKAGICGGILAFLGLSSSYFATSITYLIVSMGVITGLGFSLCFVSSFTSVGEYFSGKAKFMALSFVGIGSGIGAMVVPFLLRLLIDNYMWNGCLLIMGGLTGNMICFFAICKPKLVGLQQPKIENTKVWHTQLAEDESNKQHINKEENKDHIDKESIVYEVKPKTVQTSGMGRMKVVARNYIFDIFILGISVTLSFSGSALIYILEFLKSKGFTEQEALVMYLYMNISNTVSRLLPGLCTLTPHLDVLVLPAIFTGLSSSSSIGLVEATTYYQHVVLMCCFGMAIGATETMLSITTMELVGLENYSVAFGILLTVIGMNSIWAGAFSGWLVDFTGTYNTPYYGVPAAHGLAVCLFISAAILRRCNRNHTYRFGK